MPPVTAGEQGRPGGWVPDEPPAPPLRRPAALTAPTGMPPDDPPAAGPRAADPLVAVPDAGPDTQPVTRASLRAAREAQARQTEPARTEPVDASASGPVFVAAAGSGVALALLLGLSAYAGGVLTALATAFTAVVMVWGWASLTGAPSARSATLVTGVGVLGICATVVLTRTEPHLVWVPAALAVSVVAAMLHQVVRRHGRPRLTEGLASSVSALAITACGAPLIALPAEARGDRWVAVAMSAVAVCAALVVALRRRGTVPWVALASLVAGTGVAVLAAWLVTGLPLLGAAVLGLLVSAVAHSLLRVLLELPGAARVQAAVSVGAASVLVVGVLVYLVARVTAG